MAFRKLTMEQALDLRETRTRTGASYGILAHIFGTTVGTAWGIVQGKTYKRDRQGDYAIEPTPHDAITWDGWMRDTTPMPFQRAPHYITAEQIKAQNAHDGITRDPAMRAWLFYDAPWATADDATMAAD
jgi:hypothetical protein